MSGQKTSPFFGGIKLAMATVMVTFLFLGGISYFASPGYIHTVPPMRLKETSQELTAMTGGVGNKVQLAIEEIEKVLSQQRKQLGVTPLMVEKALKHVTSTSNLQSIILDAVTRNRTLRVGVAGGSISARKYSYANVFTEAMQFVLNVSVELHNAAVGATDSRFYAYCFGSLLNIHELDIVLWEFAANDFIKKIGPWAQEDFTRVILNLPQKPQLIFVNFLHGQQMKKKSCVNNEKIGSEPLSRYYDVPSISMPDAVCPQVKRPDFRVTDIAVSARDGHPNPKNHKLMGLFLCELLKDVLQNVTNSVETSPSFGLNLNARGDRLPHALFPESVVYLPNCWTALATKTKENVKLLQPLSTKGWELYAPNNEASPNRTDIKQFWRNNKTNNSITFSFELKPYQNFNCTVSIATFGGPKCGKAKVYLDGNTKSAVVVNGKWGYSVTLTQRISNNIPPGKHNLTIVAQRGGFFQLCAIMTSHSVKN
ncbi:uncharacterized protein [Ptychodera flava]|uniref:uncharacterized protein n=1 Tax=Ptychodera flava TaxID=63121 RepID=UPI00396AA3B0